jgi:hypothetical protein
VSFLLSYRSNHSSVAGESLGRGRTREIEEEFPRFREYLFPGGVKVVYRACLLSFGKF